MNDLDNLDLSSFEYVSFHAPSSFSSANEATVVELLTSVARRGWNVIVHPDVIYSPILWKGLDSRLLIENMDRRKPIGRNAGELLNLFRQLTTARLCLDVAHARQVDSTLSVLFELVKTFRTRIGQVHISELDSLSRHRPLSDRAVHDFAMFSDVLRSVPVIIESVIGTETQLRTEEMFMAQQALQPAVTSLIETADAVN